MAMVSPYGDPNAHGPINKTLCFQRYKGSSFLRTFPRPVSRKTPALINQRQKLTDASRDYNFLPRSSKYFYRRRASQQQRTGRALFMSAHMKKYLPSILRPITCKSIEEMVIYTPAGLYLDEIEIMITNESLLTGEELEAFCNLYNTLGSIAEVTNSEKGENGEIVGELTFKDAKYDKGVFTDSTSNYPKFAAQPDTTAGIIGGWFVAEEDSDDIPNATYRFIFSIDDRQGGDGDDIGRIWIVYHRTAAGVLYLEVAIMGPGGYAQIKYEDSFVAGDKIYIMLVYDFAGIDEGEDTIRLYRSGKVVGSSVVVSGLSFPNAPDSFLCVQSYPAIQNPMKNTLDNFKMYSAPVITQAFIDAVIINMTNEMWEAINIYGIIYDNENIFRKGEEVIIPVIQKIRISTPAGHPAHIPFRYLIGVEWKNFEDKIVNSVIRLPELIMEALTTVELFLSRDWSVYSDIDFHRLECTNQL